MKNPVIKIILEDERTITAELYPETAPISVANFINLVKQGFYNGLIFHRVIENFMIQAGGYYINEFTLEEAPECESIKGEFAQNGVENPLKHELGVLSMARTSDPNSASGQFFICSATTPHLDGAYAAFGKVIDEESLKVVLEISRTETINIGYGFSDFPAEPITIKTILLSE